jgi:XPG N-terminal domain
VSGAAYRGLKSHEGCASATSFRSQVRLVESGPSFFQNKESSVAEMPIRHLDYFLAEKKLVQEGPLSLLAETRLGIDATHYIRRILNDPETKEPLVSALGGCPLGLPARIESDLKTLEKMGIKPVFVFGGVPLARKERPLNVEDTRPHKRHQAWDFYEKGKVDQATIAFGQGTTTDINDILRIVHRAFKHRRVEFLTSPYLAASQVSFSHHPPKSVSPNKIH